MPRREKAPDQTIDELLASVRSRWERLGESSAERASFLEHVRSLARWHDPRGYPRPGRPRFPETLDVAYAVCHRDCGAREFIVDGSTQECQHCGGLMFRWGRATYRLSEERTLPSRTTRRSRRSRQRAERGQSAHFAAHGR